MRRVCWARSVVSQDVGLRMLVEPDKTAMLVAVSELSGGAGELDLHALLPVIGAASVVGDSEYVQTVWLLTVDNAVRKTSYTPAADRSSHRRAGSRRGANEPNRLLYFVRELRAQIPAFRVVELRDAGELGVGLGMKYCAFHRSRERTRAKTSSDGMACTVPERSS